MAIESRENQFSNWHKVAGLVFVALVSYECRSQTIMNQSQLTLSIYQSLENLFNTNQSLYDYWMSELYDEEGDPIHEMWNEDTLNEMEADVQKQIEVVS
jgi:hypothetical protein